MHERMALQLSRLLQKGRIVLRLHAGELACVVLVEQRLHLIGLAFATLVGQNRSHLFNGDRRFRVFLRLDFLRRALYDNDIDQNALSRKLGIDVETIDYWFRHDKCYISYFFSIAKYTGMKLKIDIRPKKGE